MKAIETVEIRVELDPQDPAIATDSDALRVGEGFVSFLGAGRVASARSSRLVSDDHVVTLEVPPELEEPALEMLETDERVVSYRVRR